MIDFIYEREKTLKLITEISIIHSCVIYQYLCACLRSQFLDQTEDASWARQIAQRTFLDDLFNMQSTTCFTELSKVLGYDRHLGSVNEIIYPGGELPAVILL